MKMKIAFFDAKSYEISYFNEANKKFGFEITYHKQLISPDNTILARGSNVLCAFVNDQITAPIIDDLYEQGIRLIALRCAGYNNVDFAAAFGKIHVVRVPGYSPYAVAEHCVALIMSLNRKIHRAYFRTRDANFSLNGLMGYDLHGKTAGIIGTGRIGKVLITILRGFGMHVLAFDPHPDIEFEKYSGCRYVTVNEIFSSADILSLNCPLSKETEYLINKETIDAMKKGVMIINTGRGKLIKTQDLIKGLKSGKVGAAGLDVYEEESDYFFKDHSNEVMNDDMLARLLSFPNVIVTSHQAFFTHEAYTNITEMTLQNIDDFRTNKMPHPNEICYRCSSANPQCHRKDGIACF